MFFQGSLFIYTSLERPWKEAAEAREAESFITLLSGHNDHRKGLLAREFDHFRSLP